MSFDVSRNSFDPKKDYLGVVMQQGRVQLDSDWNEWQAEFSRRLQAGTLDVFGRAAYPASTPAAFKIKISPSGQGLTIGAGRMYVDGLLAENHGTLPPAFTVVAADSLGNPGAYDIQLTPGTGAGTFNLSLFQAMASGPVQVGPTLGNLTLGNVQAAVGADAVLSPLIHVQDVAASGTPAALAANTRYLLAPDGPDYTVIIPSAASVSWDPALAELSETPFLPGTPEFDIDYTQQPYLPGAAAPGVGPYLVYLDVWQREITALQRPELVEPAVGVDTTGRLQTVWQVKLLDVSGVVPGSGGGITRDTPDAQIPPWANLLLPPGGTLSTGVVQSAPQGPCSLTPNTSYTGMENQLYRVEIHRPGLPAGSNPAQGTATFKWSRDNASVATAVSALISVVNAVGTTVSKLTVQSLGRDQVLGFNPGDWIELTDDYLELNGQPGELHQIDSVSAPDSTITLVDALTASGNFPTVNRLTDPSRHTRITRWDQAGKVYQSDGSTLYYDLGSAANGGAIPVPPAGTTLVLENGVTVTFGLNPVGHFRTGDYWNFAARAADGTVEPLVQAPPRGIHHHYARLAVVDFASPLNGPADCRTAWPPAAGCDCGCRVFLRPSDLAAPRTLQFLLDQYAGVQSAVVFSFLPGTYQLPAPLRLGPRHAGITFEACQPGSAILQAQPGSESLFIDGLVVLDGSSNITLSGLRFVMPAVPYSLATFAGLPSATFLSVRMGGTTNLAHFNVSIGIRPVNCVNLTVRNCAFQFPNLYNNVGYRVMSAAIFAGGSNVGLQVSENQFIGQGATTAGFLLAPAVSLNPATVSPSGASSSSGGGTVLPAALDNAVFKDNTFTGLQYAIFILAASKSVQIIENEVNGSNGFCLIAPLASAANTCPWTVSGYPLPQKCTAAVTAVASSPPAVRVYAGTAASPLYLDKQQPSHTWTPDVQTPGLTFGGTSNYNSPIPAPAIYQADGKTPNPDATLYQAERYGNFFFYQFSGLTPGFYQVTLKFAEIFGWSSREANVAINGSTVLTAFNVVTEVGGLNRSDDKVFTNAAVNASGQLTIAFTMVSTAANANAPQPAKISAIAVEPQWWGGAASSDPASQLVLVGAQGCAGIPAVPSWFRCANNDVRSTANGNALQVLGDDSVMNGKQSSLVVVGNRFQSTISDSSSGVIISSVTRCVVTGNMIVYDNSPQSGTDQVALRLDNSGLLPNQGNNGLTNSASVAVSIAGNILQGTLSVSSPPVVQGQIVPAPMNQWAFFNTLIA